MCPLCGGPLHPEQEWCLRCGAAARTRLAAAPNWRGPAIAIALIIAISLGVLAASLIKLAGESGSKSSTTIAVGAAAGTTAAGVITNSTTAGTITATTAAGVITTPTTGAAAPTVTPPAASTVPLTTQQARERALAIKRQIEGAVRERHASTGK